MPTYISPTGNPEIWEEKPDNYYTEKEWESIKPQPAPITLEDSITAKLQEVVAAYASAFAQIKTPTDAAQWRMIYAYLTEQQQRMYAEVSVLTDVNAVLAYPITYTMPEGF